MTDVSGWRKRQIEQSEMCSNYGGFCKKEWVGLTEDEVSKLIDNEIGFNSCCGWEEEYTRAVEAKLKEKNT